MWQSEAKYGKVRQDMARRQEGNAGRGKVRQSKAKYGKRARYGKVRQDMRRRQEGNAGWAKYGKIRQNMARRQYMAK